MTDGRRDILHATAIAAGGRAVLFLGPSGSGKSDLALRCIALGNGPLWPEPAMLLADDGVEIKVTSDGPVACAPDSIAGLLEVRDIGVVRLQHSGPAPVHLCVELGSSSRDRLPDGTRSVRIGGFDIPAIVIDPFEASAPIKVLLAVAAMQNRDETGIMPVAGS